MEKQLTEDEIQKLIQNRFDEINLTNLEEKRIQKEIKKKVLDLKKEVDVIDTCNGNNSVGEEKIKFLLQKYEDLLSENFKLEIKTEKVHKDNFQLSNELNKTTGVKVKLESIARELQKRNLSLITENKRISVEEEQRRDLLSGKFNDSMKEITNKMNEFNEQRDKHNQHIDELNNKIKIYSEQFELREKQHSVIVKTKELEKQVLESKLKHQMELTTTETIRVKAFKEQVEKAFKEEYSLRSTVAFYEEKFKQFQEAITKSNDVFANFKTEMDKISKYNRLLEKENLNLKQKSNQTDKVLIEMIEERNSNRKNIETLKNLCRSLTNERAELKTELKKFNEQDVPSILPDNSISNEIESIEKSTVNKENQIKILIDNSIKENKEREKLINESNEKFSASGLSDVD